MPAVSVVIPAYNAMAYLPLALGSVLSQTFEDFEVIIINDGSVDHIETWFAQSVSDPRVTLVSQANKGLSVARNTGIQKATGTYIAFLDADDLWEPDKLAQQIQVLEEDRAAGLVYTWVAYIDEQGYHTGRVRKNEAEGMVWSTLIQHNIVECGSVALVRRACFDKVGLFDESLRAVEDFDMWLRLSHYYPFRVIAQPLVYYRQHTAGLSRNWPVMEACINNVLDRSFSSAASEFAPLKARSYALAHLCVGWKPIQHQQRDHREASRLLRKAVSHDWQIVFSKEFLHLGLAIATIKCLGGERYSKLLSVFHKVRHRVVNTNTATT